MKISTYKVLARRYWYVALIVIVMTPFARYWLGGQLTERVAYGEKGLESRVPYGYSLEKYRWRDGFRLRLWVASRMTLTLDTPIYELTRIRSARWTPDGSSVVLDLDGVYHDSIDFPANVALLFDFHRAELVVFDPNSLWTRGAARGITRAEFDATVSRAMASR